MKAMFNLTVIEILLLEGKLAYDPRSGLEGTKGLSEVKAKSQKTKPLHR